jgi:hypothetical protein
MRRAMVVATGSWRIHEGLGERKPTTVRMMAARRLTQSRRPQPWIAARIAVAR